jgi:hypothetical protein
MRLFDIFGHKSDTVISDVGSSSPHAGMAPKEGDGIKIPKYRNGNKDTTARSFEWKSEKEIQIREKAR